MTTAAEVAGALIPVIRTSPKPVVFALMGEDLIAHAARLLRQSRIPDYRFPERAASAVSVLVRRAEQLAQPQDEPGGTAGVRPDLTAVAVAHHHACGCTPPRPPLWRSRSARSGRRRRPRALKRRPREH